jgi:hypothetical protein
VKPAHELALEPVPEFYFDDSRKQRYFADTRGGGPLAKRAWTEAELVAEALAMRPGMTPSELAHDGAIVLARQILYTTKAAARRATGRNRGAADARIAEAYRKMVAENKRRSAAGQAERPISPSTLMYDAKTNFSTAKRWFEDNVGTDGSVQTGPAGSTGAKARARSKR